MEAVIDFIFLGSKIPVDSDHSYEIKRCLPLGRKTMTNLDSVLKSRDITLLTKVLLVRAMVFLVVMYGCESWTIKKAERWRIDAFELWLKKILESLGQQGDQTSQKKSILTIHWKDWCWSSNTLTTWWEELTHWKRPWCWETLKVGGEGDKEDEMVGWHHWLNGHEFEQAPGSGEGQGGLACRRPQVRRELDTTELLNNNKNVA